MLEKRWHQNRPLRGKPPTSSVTLHRQGHYLLRRALSASEVRQLRDEVEEVFRTFPPDMRARPSVENAEMFRYEMFNRSALCQEVIARACILEVVEPLLGPDCHVISCTAWKNPPGNTLGADALEWHVDGGPHVPRRRGIRWPKRIPYPVFVVATHIYLQDVEMKDGPTAFVPTSHTSGTLPPHRKRKEEGLRYRGRGSVAHLAEAGDISFFVSDVWHRRLTPTAEAAGRFFLQTNYARREIAQRVRPTGEVSHATEAAIARARTEREQQLIGVHPFGFYDG